MTAPVGERLHSGVLVVPQLLFSLAKLLGVSPQDTYLQICPLPPPLVLELCGVLCCCCCCKGVNWAAGGYGLGEGCCELRERSSGCGTGFVSLKISLIDLGVCCALASDRGASCEGMACDWKLWSCLAISRSCCEGSRFKTAGMLAGGADDEAAVDLGACSAANDIVYRSMWWIGRDWRMEEGRVGRRRVVKRSKRQDDVVFRGRRRGNRAGGEWGGKSV
jgi:hypothetical protein